jgi:polyhydroxyalkanoate synthesis regulator phasin
MVTKEEPKTETEVTYSIHEGVHRLVMAGIGLMSIMHEKLEKHIDKLAEHGEAVEKDREKLVKEMKEKREKFLKDRKGYTQKRVAEALEHLDVPSKSDLETINTKLESLEKKIDDLSKPKE